MPEFSLPFYKLLVYFLATLFVLFFKEIKVKVWAINLVFNCKVPFFKSMLKSVAQLVGKVAFSFVQKSRHKKWNEKDRTVFPKNNFDNTVTQVKQENFSDMCM